MEGFGYYVYWMSIFTLSGMLISSGVENVQLHKIAINKTQKIRILCEAYAIRLYPFLFATVVSIIFSILTGRVPLIITAAYTLYALATFLSVNWIHYALSKAPFAAAVDLGAKTVFLTSFIICGTNYEQAILFYAATHLSASICFLLPLGKKRISIIFSQFHNYPKYNKSNINVLIASLFSVPLNQMVPIVTMNVFGPIFVANFGIMEKILSGVKSLYEPIGKVLTPIITRHVQDNISKRWIMHAGAFVIIPTLALTLIVTFYSTELLQFVSNGQFSPVYLLYFHIYSITIILNILITFFGINVLLGLGNSYGYRNGRALAATSFAIILFLTNYLKSELFFFIGLVMADLIMLTYVIYRIILMISDDSQAAHSTN